MLPPCCQGAQPTGRWSSTGQPLHSWTCHSFLSLSDSLSLSKDCLPPSHCVARACGQAVAERPYDTRVCRSPVVRPRESFFKNFGDLYQRIRLFHSLRSLGNCLPIAVRKNNSLYLPPSLAGCYSLFAHSYFPSWVNPISLTRNMTNGLQNGMADVPCAFPPSCGFVAVTHFWNIFSLTGGVK